MKKDKISGKGSLGKSMLFAAGGVGVTTAVIVPTMYYSMDTPGTSAQGSKPDSALSAQLDELELAHQKLIEQSQEIDNLSHQLDALEAEKERIQGLIDNSQSQISTDQAEIERLNKLIAGDAEALAQARQDINTLVTQKNQMAGEISHFQSEIDRIENENSDDEAEISRLEALLTSQTGDEAAQTQKQIDDLNTRLRMQSTMREQYQQLLADMEQDNADAEAEITRLNGLIAGDATAQRQARDEITSLQSRLEMQTAMREQYQRMIAEIENNYEDAEAQLANAQQEKTALQTTIDKLNREIQSLHNEISLDEQKIRDEEAEIARLSHMVVDPAHVTQLYEHYESIYDGDYIQGQTAAENTINTWYEHFQLIEMGVKDFSMFDFAPTYRIPEGTLFIPDYAFNGARFDLNHRFTLPTSIKEIGDYAFTLSVMPNGFRMPTGVTSVGRAAFDFASLPAAFSYSANHFTYVGPHALSNAWIGRVEPAMDSYILVMGNHAELRGHQVAIDISREMDKISLPSTIYINSNLESNMVANFMSGEYAFGPTGEWMNRSDNQWLSRFGLLDVRIDSQTQEMIFTFGTDGINTPQQAASNFYNQVVIDLDMSNLAPSYLDQQGLGITLTPGITRVQDGTANRKTEALADQAATITRTEPITQHVHDASYPLNYHPSATSAAGAPADNIYNDFHSNI